MDKSQCMFLFFFIILVNSLFGNNNEIMDRRNRFINEGFGFEYNTEDSENIELFLLRHGNPINIYEDEVIDFQGNIVGKHIILEYETIFVTFSKRRVRGTNNYDSLLLSINSKNNINYLYNIGYGLTIIELEKIIGKIEEFIGESGFVLLISENNNAVRIYFNNNNKIEDIIWYYLLQ